MKVMLIQPASLDRSNQPVYARKAWFDDLTLSHLAALTPRDVQCQAVVERLEGVDFDADVDLVGLSAMGVSPMARAYQIAERFRSRGVKVVFGGINFSLHAAEARQHCDALLTGEAETVWPKLIDDCRHGRLEPVYEGTAPDNLAGLPVPRYDLFYERPEFRGAFFTVQASRGCPHRCDFCAIASQFGGRVRFRPLHEVVRDVQATRSRRIFFADDNMTSNPTYYKELFRRLIPLKVRWVGAATLAIARDPEMLALARRSGCLLLIIGLESVSQQSLDDANKNFNRVKEYGTLIKRIHDAGIIASCSTIFGFDGDDPSVFEHTADFFIENRVRVAPLFVLTPVPGTSTWAKLRREGRMLTDDYTRYDTISAVFRPARMSPSELEEGLVRAYRKLYGLGSSLHRLLPPLGNPMADLLAGAMNFKYFFLARRGGLDAFNFN